MCQGRLEVASPGGILLLHQAKVGKERKIITLKGMLMNPLGLGPDRQVMLVVTLVFVEGVPGRSVMSQFVVLTMKFCVIGVTAGSMLAVKESQNRHMKHWCSTSFVLITV